MRADDHHDPIRAAAVDDLHFATALYTSADVVSGLLDKLGWPRPGSRLLDPSVGDGAFLVSALVRLAPAPGDFAAVQRVMGIELHPGAVADARARVRASLEDAGWSSRDAALAAAAVVRQGDFIADGLPEGAGVFDIIAANPPYLRWANVPGYFRGLYEGSVPRHARNDLLHAFLDRIVEILPDHGVVGLVAADRFLLNETAAGLREEMGKRVGIDHLARLDAATSFYRPKVRRKGAPPRIHPVELVLRRAGVAALPITAAAISPDGRLDDGAGPRLGDVALVRLAPWLGPDGSFVVDAATAGALPGADLLPAVDTDDIGPHSDRLAQPSKWAIVTARDEEPVGAVRDHLLALAPGMPKRGGRGRPWWRPMEPITLPLHRSGLIVPRIAKRLRAVPLRPGVLPVNHNLTVVYPPDGVSVEELAEAITSEESQRWVAARVPRLENGFLSITTTWIKRLPVPGLVGAEALAA